MSRSVAAPELCGILPGLGCWFRLAMASVTRWRPSCGKEFSK